MTPKCRHLLCTDNDKSIHLHSITRRFLSDVQTDVHFVRVDSDSPIRKLAVTLIYQCKWCSNKALTCFSAAPFPMLQLNYSIDLQAIYLQQSTWVDNMVDKSCALYLYQKRGVYYFSKQVPCDVKQHYSRNRIFICPCS